MKVLMYDAKAYDIESFDKQLKNYEDISIDYIDTDLTSRTVNLCKGYDAICIFVNCKLDKNVIKKLKAYKIKLVLLRCSGFNNVDVKQANKAGITILRVATYSPEAIAEHALALALCVNRKIHKSYIKVRENNFSLIGLTGFNFYKKTAGIIGTGRIGKAMCRICHGLGMKVIAYSPTIDSELDFVKYVSLDELFKNSDLISLHCPATEDNYHLINKDTINKMKNGVILINTSRGLLVNTEDLIQGIRNKKFFGVGLDVYEEEGNNVFENREDDILESSITARLLSFPNVVITSHQAFLTHEALDSIAEITLKNIIDYMNDTIEKHNLVI